jgi:hypothetical protein
MVDPLDPPQLGQGSVEDSRIGEVGERTEERQLSGRERLSQLFQEQSPEQAGEHPY